jgi:hypothetical protein
MLEMGTKEELYMFLFLAVSGLLVHWFLPLPEEKEGEKEGPKRD